MEEIDNTVVQQEQQFGEVIDIILQHQSRASHVVNDELLLTAWQVYSSMNIHPNYFRKLSRDFYPMSPCSQKLHN